MIVHELPSRKYLQLLQPVLCHRQRIAACCALVPNLMQLSNQLVSASTAVRAANNRVGVLND